MNRYEVAEMRESSANAEIARLRAQNAELLEACKSGLEVVEECDPETVRFFAPKIRAAIRRAEEWKIYHHASGCPKEDRFAAHVEMMERARYDSDAPSY